MHYYTPVEYLKINIASQFGHDKELFSFRLNWTNQNIDSLEELAKDADEPFVYLSAVQALRDTMKGKPIGYLCGFDATASGMSILGVMTGCEKSIRITNLIDPTKRYDAYTEGVIEMNLRLDEVNKIGNGFNITRKEVKDAIMTHYYGSRAQPIEHLGYQTPAHKAFYPSMYKLAPGASQAMDILLAVTDETKVVNVWTLPDHHTARVPVMIVEDKKIEIEELGGATCTHRMKVNKPKENDVSLVAK